MNIKDLANLDIKDIQNLDYKIILDEAKKHPDIIIKSVIIIITIALCLFFFTKNKNNFQSLTSELQTLTEKSEIYANLTTAQGYLKTLKSVFPDKISEAQLIELIAETTQQYNISISSFSPAKQTQTSIYSTLSLTLTINAPSYQNLWKFISALENNYKTLRIETWTISPRNTRRRFQRGIQTKNAPASSMSSSMVISVINFKS